MTLTDYRTLGRSGLVVSPLALGTMTFGTDRWGTDESTSRKIFDVYREADGNFIDTADIYSGGTSEEMVGKFIADTGARDSVVLATKFGFNNSSDPNLGGNGAKNIHRALEGSLKRLQTDYVDMYWMHVWDGATPVEEILQTLGDLVRSGKIRYFGFADMPAWVAIKAAAIAGVRGIPAPIALQMEYSLVARGIERSLIAGAIDGGMAVQPWSPLAGGFLAGKYKRGETDDKGRLSGDNPLGDTKFTERNFTILDVLREVAEASDCTPAQAAIAWTLSQRGIVSPVMGASRPEQLEDTIAALDINLSSEALGRLAEASAPEPEFGDVGVMKGIGPIAFGGNQVRSWTEQ